MGGGLVATNFLPGVDLGPPLAAYRHALASHNPGVGFSVVAEGTGNRIAVQTCGGTRAIGSFDEMASQMRAAAADVAHATACPFDMPRLATRGIYEWSTVE